MVCWVLFSDIERISLSFHLMIQKEEPLQTFHSPICCSEDFQSLVCSPFWVPSPDPDLTRLQLGHHCHTLAPGLQLSSLQQNSLKGYWELLLLMKQPAVQSIRVTPVQPSLLLTKYTASMIQYCATVNPNTKYRAVIIL